MSASDPKYFTEPDVPTKTTIDVRRRHSLIKRVEKNTQYPTFAAFAILITGITTAVTNISSAVVLWQL